MLKRAYSLLTVKSFDEEKREIRGTATTPSTDSYGDIVESEGAEFNLPLPLLSQHNANKPVGHVTHARVAKDGIDVITRLVKPGPDDPKSWSDRINEAWADAKSGLVRGFSIGFKPIEYAYMDDGGIRFMKWQWLELSLVTIPANGDATISAVRSMYQAQQAATGQWRRPIRLIPFDPGVTGKSALNSGAVQLITRSDP
jgi:HK97 family phage prohead protease